VSEYAIDRVGDGATLADARTVRLAVFVEEQGVPRELELDGREPAAQFVCYRGGEPVGTARMRLVGDRTAKAERVAVLPAHRGRGLGRRLMETVERAARERNCRRVQLHAQTAVAAFYRTLGYEQTGGEFEEAGIAHVPMEKAFRTAEPG
jgi:predicted GNAT family N-acyltransferase